MIDDWTPARVPLKFWVGPFVIGAVTLRLRQRYGMFADANPIDGLPALARSLAADEDGFFVRSLPLLDPVPPGADIAPLLVYVVDRYQRYAIDMTGTFEGYLNKFSGKSRSTLKRKVRRFAEHSGGTIDWRQYRTAESIDEFYSLARQVSQVTYQEKLYNAGLPVGDAFRREIRDLAGRGLVRAYLLFHAGEPVSYLYCPIENGRLMYRYLGFRADHAKWSPGTVLQVLALEALFAEGGHAVFDFTEGEGEHKRFFSTECASCCDVLYLKRTARLRALVQAHRGVSRLGTGIVAAIDRLGLKHKLRRLIRSN